jgi:hypothetical protein
VQLIGALLAALIGQPSPACGAVPSNGFDKTFQEYGTAQQLEPKLRRPEQDAVTMATQGEAFIGLAFLSEMKVLELCVTGTEQLDEMTPSPAGLVSSHEEDSLLKREGVESLPLRRWDFSIDLLNERHVQFDVDQASAQNLGRQQRAADPRALVAERRKGIHWGSLISQWWLDISVEQTERIIMEAKTRDQLAGKFFHEWFSDVAQYRYGLWNDGDKFFTSYIGHPLQGAVIEAIFWQNNDRVRFAEQDFHSAAYRKALWQAFAFAAVDAVQWKLGPVSEASIGHVGLPAHWWDTSYFCNLSHTYCHPRTGLNDLVMNEVGGTAMLVGFQWLDKHFQRPMENRIHSPAVIDAMRIFTNPPQSLANFFRFRTPWYRDNRE